MSGRLNNPDPACVDVALDLPMRQTFSYCYAGAPPAPGVRVRVPFGRRNLVGVVIAWRARRPEKIRLRSIEQVLDEQPVLSAGLLNLIAWTASYYHQPLGEVCRVALPVILRKSVSQTQFLLDQVYKLARPLSECQDQLRRAPLQRRIVEVLASHDGEVSRRELREAIPHSAAAVKALLKRRLIEVHERPAEIDDTPPATPPNSLTQDQQRAFSGLSDDTWRFSCRVLEGITGSGKTEIYFAMIDRCLDRGKQALVLLPEIALTDQLFARFRQRFGGRVVQVHSGLNDAQRYRHWWQIRDGGARVIIATRSGIFLAFSELGLIIVDEEHDLSYKQQDGVRYHARSVAIKRAQLEDIPILLGSATPSLETCHNVSLGRYPRVQLKQRIGNSRLPEVVLVDLNREPDEAGLTGKAVDAIAATLAKKQQTLVYINRRGYAPVLFCPACQWTAQCRRCDAQMTLHRVSESLQCHHCGARRPLPASCDSCGHDQLIDLGEGTQKIEEQLASRFPEARIQRFDRDQLNSAKKLREALHEVHAGRTDILVGTQLLSKGHDFGGVSLVLVINADQGLYSNDFRAPEHMVQQLIQVAGRAGRGDEPGQVLIQTRLPQHPALLAVKHYRYAEFVDEELKLRQQAHFPPFAHLALWRARASNAHELMQFLERLADLGRENQLPGTLCFDPVRSPMFRRGGWYHAQLLVSAEQRGPLHHWLDAWIARIDHLKATRKVIWSIDVDPVSLF